MKVEPYIEWEAGGEPFFRMQCPPLFWKAQPEPPAHLWSRESCYDSSVPIPPLFSCSTGHEHSWENQGQLAQVAVLHWVQDHIANFGGEPRLCDHLYRVSSKWKHLYYCKFSYTRPHLVVDGTSLKPANPIRCELWEKEESRLFTGLLSWASGSMELRAAVQKVFCWLVVFKDSCPYKQFS
jgi:hypothetical protein